MKLNYQKLLISLAGFSMLGLSQIDSSDLNGTDRDDQLLWQGAKSLSMKSPAPWVDQDKIAIASFGREIFFDESFSKGGKVSCASCHDPDLHFTDAKSVAIAQGVGSRNTPTVVNTRWSKWFFLDGRADSLVAQAMFPFEHPNEHSTHRYQVFARVIKSYLGEYTKHFGHPAGRALAVKALALVEPLKSEMIKVSLSRGEKSDKPVSSHEDHYKTWSQAYKRLSAVEKKRVDKVFTNVALALAVYQRSLVSLNAPFDRFIARWNGNGRAVDHTDVDFSKKALHGLDLFLGKAACVRCHNGPMLSDQEFYNVGFPQRSSDLGRFDGLVQLGLLEFPCRHPLFAAIPWVSQSDACEEKAFISKAGEDYKAAFKTPSLRDVAKTAPYGHQGTIESLELVIEHYDEAKFASLSGHPNPMLRPIGLSKKEQEALAEFLKSLTGELTSLAHKR